MAPHYWKNTADMVTPNRWSPEYETDIALEYLKKRPQEVPFCLFLSWNPPHPPYDQVPEKEMDLYREKTLPDRENVPEEWKQDAAFQQNKKEYFAAGSGVDEQFGRLLDYLKESGLEKDTLIVLSADHGDCMGSHGRYGKNIRYEESIRIPLYFRGAGISPGKPDVLFASQHHMPTIL